MNHPHYILLPANPIFIAFTLLCAFFMNLLPWGSWIGVPDFVALALVFWSIHQPRKVGIGIAFFMGLLMDVHDAVHLGENALAYTLLTYFAITIHRRVLWFPTLTQSIHVLPLFLFVQMVQMTVRMVVASDASFPSPWYFSESVVSTVLWPLATLILLAPQRRAINKDATRPI